MSRRYDLLQILDNHCRAENMKAKLHSDPCRSEYDFLYLPMDFWYLSLNLSLLIVLIYFPKIFNLVKHFLLSSKNHLLIWEWLISYLFSCGANLGYAFVNFTTSVAAVRFAKAFDKKGWEARVPGNKKTCQVSRAAIQVINLLFINVRWLPCLHFHLLLFNNFQFYIPSSDWSF